MLSQKLVDQFTYLGSNISSAESNVNIRMRRVWTIIERLIYQIKKTGILPSYNCINAIVWLHQLDFNETIGEKARWELRKSIACYLQQILEVVLYKTAVVRRLAFHLTNYPSKTCSALLEKQDRTHKWSFPENSYTWKLQWWSTSKVLQTLALCWDCLQSTGPTRRNGR